MDEAKEMFLRGLYPLESQMPELGYPRSSFCCCFFDNYFPNAHQMLSGLLGSEMRKHSDKRELLCGT